MRGVELRCDITVTVLRNLGDHEERMTNLAIAAEVSGVSLERDDGEATTAVIEEACRRALAAVRDAADATKRLNAEERVSTSTSAEDPPPIGIGYQSVHPAPDYPTAAKPRPRFGPDGSITNLGEFPKPEPREYRWCKNGPCGHEAEVHDENGCNGIKVASDGGQDGSPCPCDGFVEGAPPSAGEDKR